MNGFSAKWLRIVTQERVNDTGCVTVLSRSSHPAVWVVIAFGIVTATVATAMVYLSAKRADLMGRLATQMMSATVAIAGLTAVYMAPTMLFGVKSVMVRPVLTPHQAWLQLRAMHEKDGTQTFSVSQAGSVQALSKGEVCEGCELNTCTGYRGKLITVGIIKSDFLS